jgi:hypothetical protein
VSDIRKAVTWARSANQTVYVLCTEYSSFPCGARCPNPRAVHGVPIPVRCTVCQSPCGARCANPRAPSNNHPLPQAFHWRLLVPFLEAQPECTRTLGRAVGRTHLPRTLSMISPTVILSRFSTLTSSHIQLTTSICASITGGRQAKAEHRIG